MPTRKPAAHGRSESSGRKSATRSKLRPVPNGIAARYCAGQEAKVRDALAPFGEIEVYQPHRMVVLERSPHVAAGRVKTVLEDLRRRHAVEFVTPLLLDPESNTRQVLTDEIVLRLKPGRTKRTLQALGAAHGVKISRRNEFEPSQYVLKVPSPSGTQTLDIARSLDASDDVEFACPNFLTEIKR
jgi:hypothetical protein